MSEVKVNKFSSKDNFNIKSMGRPTMPRYAPRPPMSPFEDPREMYDKCMLCGEKTMYKKTDHVDKRMGYIEGAGQLCVSCDRKHSEGGVSRFA